MAFHTWLFPLPIHSLPPIFLWLKRPLIFSDEKKMFHYVNTPVYLSIFPLWALVVVVMFSAIIGLLLCHCDQKVQQEGEKSACGSRIRSFCGEEQLRSQQRCGGCRVVGQGNRMTQAKAAHNPYSPLQWPLPPAWVPPPTDFRTHPKW